MVVNSCCHRAYNIKGTEIQIKMFDDRIVFETPGDLPGLVRPDNIRHTHFSRNPKIAQFLKAYKYVKEFDSPSTAQVEKLVAVMNDDYVDVPEMMKLCGIVRRKTMQDSYIAPALTDGSIERKYPEQPNHPKQMYSLSEKAKAWKKTNN